MSDGLIEFVRARLDDEAAVAGEATQETTGRWTARETDWGGGAIVEDDCGALILPTAANAGHYQHIARHNPARVLAEIEAKREMLRLFERSHDYPAIFTSGFGAAMEQVVRLFAAPYADHPDYRQQWTP